MAYWDRISSRGNVEDRRGLAPVIGGVSLTGVALYLLFNMLTGGDLSDALNQLQNVPVNYEQNVNNPEFAGQDEYEVFASTVLGSSNDYWETEFSGINATYDEPRLVLFREATQSACGTATSDVGPHYCPLDSTIYLDETFFDELTNRFGAQGGDVAQAYVIAHEVGHHVQNELGTMDRVLQTQEASIALELQADCYAGMWAGTIRDQGVLEPGEISEAVDVAAAVGDDRIQSSVTGQVNPETWTHGSSEQRVNWFTRGYNSSGDMAACDTFSS